MVHAVCFNLKAFTAKYDSIVNDIDAEDGGRLINSLPVNCIESFPNGMIYRSYSDPLMVNKGIINCQDDIDKFIYVNKFGK